MVDSARKISKKSSYRHLLYTKCNQEYLLCNQFKKVSVSILDRKKAFHKGGQKSDDLVLF